VSESEFFLRNALLPDATRGDIGIGGGRITKVVRNGGGKASFDVPAIDLDGALVLPGFTDGHIHLDKTVIGRKWLPHKAERNRMSRIETEKITEKTLNLPTEERASTLIQICVAKGTSHIRTHCDVGTDIHLTRLEGMLKARERYKSYAEIEIVAFPQSGVMRHPGSLEVVDEAIRMGADLVGGIDPLVIDHDAVGQLDGIFGIADKHGVGIDIHVHEPGDLGIHSIQRICERTETLNMQGKVTVSHGFSLGMVTEKKSRETAERMARAGVSLVTHGAGASAIPPILMLREVGVEVFAGNDDVRDTWAPFGSGDMLERAMLIAWRSDLRHDHLLEMVLDIVSGAPARLRGDEPWGIVEGAPADLCAVKAQCVPEAIVAFPPRKLVIKGGWVVARDDRFLDAREKPV
jgi:cytosine/adenosine deaminase-related metal-dependent hydrolase